MGALRMKKLRQTQLARRKDRKKIESTKKIIMKVNAGLVLFASATVLSQVAPPVQVAHAQMTKSQFLELVTPFAKDIASRNDLYASVMIAQAALESGWGNSGLSSAPNYNLFGIKGSYNGNSVNMNTLEDDGSGNYYQINDGFRKYSNYGESLQDYADLLTGNNDPNSWRYKFYYGARVSQTNSYQDATAHLTGRYATDTAYARKLNSIIEQNGLTQYDSRRMTNTTINPSPAQPTNTTATPNTSTAPAGGTYTVQAGDSYWRIASRYGVSIQALQQLNGASNYNLYPGQTLKVPGSATASTSTTPTTNTTATSNTSTASVGGTYTVQAGDSYWRIASRYGVSIQALQQLNGASNYNLYPGQTLKVPGSATASTSTTPTTNTTATPNTSTASAGGTYTVQAGDSYWRIASRYGVSIQALQQLNGASNYNLYPGQTLKVPGSATASTSTTPTTPTTNTTATPNTSTAPAGGTYTVQAGDSYWRIASRYGLSIQALQQLNGASNYNLYPGQVLKVAGTASAPTPAPVVQTETAQVQVTQTQVSTPQAASAGDTYVVQAGDTLYRIAVNRGLDVYKLIELNGGTHLVVGQTIRLN